MDKDEEIYRNIYSMTALKNKLKPKTLEVGDKGSGSINLEPKIQEEEATRKVKEETSQRLAEGARKLLAEEKQWEKEEEASRKEREEEKRKKEEAIQENIVELKKSIAQEALSLEPEVQDQEGLTEKQTKESQDDVGGKDQGWIPVQNDREDLPSTSKNIHTGGHLPLVELELVPFTPSKKYDVACLEDV